jgi:hypothetical protein
MEEEEDIVIILALHKNKRPKHSGSMFDRERLMRVWIEGDHRLVKNYFVASPVYPERYFRLRFRMGMELFKSIAEAMKLHDFSF